MVIHTIENMIWLTLSSINTNDVVKNVTHVMILLQVSHIWFPILLGKSITYIKEELALHQTLYIWHIAKNVKSNVLGPQFYGNQNHVTIKVISRRTFVLAKLLLILMMNVAMRKYLSNIKRLSLLTSGLICNQIEYLLLKKEKFWFGTLVR